VLDYPAVSAWLLDSATHLHHGRVAAARPERLAAVAAAAAVRAEVAATVDIPERSRVDGVLRLPSLGAARLPAGPARLTTSPEAVTLAAGGNRLAIPRGPQREDAGWRPLHRLTAEHAGLRLELLVDGWEPGPMGGSVVVGDADLSETDAGRWRAVLSAGWRLLVSHHRCAAEEVAAVHRMLVPLRSAGPAQASSTPSDAFGAVAMSLPPDPRTAALTLAHEAQHAKLSVLADLFPLVQNGAQAQRFYAPWRPDPRPPSALLQGIYAHLGVAGFWRRQRLVERDSPEAEVEFGRWRAASHDAAVALLGSGALTAVGTRFVAGILRVLEGWCSDTVPPAAMTAARRLARQHRERWCRTHGGSWCVR